MRCTPRSCKALASAILLAGASFPLELHSGPQTPMITVPAGTRILIRMTDTVDSSRNPVGSIFTGTVETDVEVGGTTAVTKGTTVHGRLTEAKQAGRMAGKSELKLELTDIIVNGKAYSILSSDYEVQGKSSGGKTARRVFGGAGLGAAIGAIAGSAGMGAAIGAVSGTTLALATKGEKVVVPSETLLEFRLDQPASVPAPR